MRTCYPFHEKRRGLIQSFNNIGAHNRKCTSKENGAMSNTTCVVIGDSFHSICFCNAHVTAGKWLWQNPRYNQIIWSRDNGDVYRMIGRTNKSEWTQLAPLIITPNNDAATSCTAGNSPDQEKPTTIRFVVRMTKLTRQRGYKIITRRTLTFNIDSTV